MSDETPSARFLRAAIGLRGPVEPSAETWGEWLGIARRERSLPLLYRAAMESSGDLRSSQIQEIEEEQIRLMGALVRFECVLLEVAGLFEGRGLPFVVLKGVASAHLDYPDPALRQFGDVDVLVSPETLLPAVEVLSAAGWHQPYALPRHHEAFTHAITMRSSTGVEIDLHQRIGHRALGELVPTAELHSARTELTIGDRTLGALSDDDRLIHAAVHSVSSRGRYHRLSSDADVLVMSHRRPERAAAVLARAERWKLRSLVATGVLRAYGRAQVPLPEQWVRECARRPHRRDRLIDSAYLAPERRPVLEELAYLRLLGRWSQKARYVSGYFATDPAYASRHGRRGLRQQSKYLWSRLRSKNSSGG